MTTTDIFQVLPDFYLSEIECTDSKKTQKPNTNPRYPSYCQVHFTAGDVDQFQTYRDQTNGENSPVIADDDNVWVHNPPEEFGENIDWGKYKDLSTDSVDNTFSYIFDKFKKGVFIKIKNNKLDVFLPFSKINFVNEWGHKIKHDPSFKDMTSFLIEASRMQGYKIRPENINRNISEWYSNNCLVRYEQPNQENDKDLSIFKDMLTTLCRERDVPDIEFFLNRRDFPLIKKNATEAYEQIFDSENYPLMSHRYDRYSPILSMVTTNTNADIPIPTWEDWARVSNQDDGKFYKDACRSYTDLFDIPWDDKIPTAIFRGATTGCGVTIETNPRLKVAYLSTVSPIEDGIQLLNAGITKWNLRPRKNMGNPYLQIIDPRNLPLGLVDPMQPKEQSRYKYIVHVDGHVSAFRLSLEMSMGSVILLAESKYRLWFRKYLQEYIHYVPVAADLSDLFEKIRWCRQNDDKCREIANNALIFYQTYLKRKGILDYMQLLFIRLKEIMGDYLYNTLSVSDVLKSRELGVIASLQEDEEEKHSGKFFERPPKMGRNFYWMEGLQIFIRKNRGFDRPANIALVHQSRNGTVHSANFFGNPLIVKKSKRSDELINEIFVGITSVNDLIKDIPNFRYSYYLGDDFSVLEHIEGVTLKKYINDRRCSVDDLTGILMMLSLSLAVAQERTGFVHYDLYSWNIVLQKIPKSKYIYQFGNMTFVVETDTVPVMIDYGRSHVIHSDMHYGTVIPFETRVFQDCFSIVVNCIYEMINSVRTSANDEKKLIHMANFFTGTVFHKFPLKTFSDLDSFVNKHKKYNEMIFGKKCGLESKNPTEMFFHLSALPHNINISQLQYPNKIPPPLPENPVFYYNIMTGTDPIQNAVEYIDNIEQKYESLLGKAKNVLSYTNTCNMILLALESTKYFLTSFSPSAGVAGIDKCDSISKSILLKFTNSFGTKNKTIPGLEYHDPHETLNIADYGSKTFSVPGKILTIVQGPQKLQNENILEYRKMIVFNLVYDLPCKIYSERSFFRDVDHILSLSPLVIRNFNANIISVREVGKKIFEKDFEEFSKMKNKPEKTIGIMRSILDIIN